MRTAIGRLRETSCHLIHSQLIDSKCGAVTVQGSGSNAQSGGSVLSGRARYEATTDNTDFTDPDWRSIPIRDIRGFNGWLWLRRATVTLTLETI
jgi:hypothetical protein